MASHVKFIKCYKTNLAFTWQGNFGLLCFLPSVMISSKYEDPTFYGLVLFLNVNTAMQYHNTFYYIAWLWSIISKYVFAWFCNFFFKIEIINTLAECREGTI